MNEGLRGGRMDARELGKRIKAAREAKGWRQKDLAERSGVTKSHISKVEADITQASMESFLKICGGAGLNLLLYDEAATRLHFMHEAKNVIDTIVGLQEVLPDDVDRRRRLCQSLMTCIVPALSRAYFGKDRPPPPKSYGMVQMQVCRICNADYSTAEDGLCKDCGVPDDVWITIVQKKQ